MRLAAGGRDEGVKVMPRLGRGKKVKAKAPGKFPPTPLAGCQGKPTSLRRGSEESEGNRAGVIGRGASQ